MGSAGEASGDDIRSFRVRLGADAQFVGSPGERRRFIVTDVLVAGTVNDHIVLRLSNPPIELAEFSIGRGRIERPLHVALRSGLVADLHPG